MSQRSPEAARGLRRLLRGLPSAVHHAVMGCSLQRSGCVLCGVGPHGTQECPRMSAEVAEKKAENLLRRWASLIGKELTIFARSSTTGVYSEEYNFVLQIGRIFRKDRPAE